MAAKRPASEAPAAAGPAQNRSTFELPENAATVGDFLDQLMVPLAPLQQAPASSGSKRHKIKGIVVPPPAEHASSASPSSAPIHAPLAVISFKQLTRCLSQEGRLLLMGDHRGIGRKRLSSLTPKDRLLLDSAAVMLNRRSEPLPTSQANGKVTESLLTRIADAVATIASVTSPAAAKIAFRPKPVVAGPSHHFEPDREVWWADLVRGVIEGKAGVAGAGPLHDVKQTIEMLRREGQVVCRIEDLRGTSSWGGENMMAKAVLAVRGIKPRPAVAIIFFINWDEYIAATVLTYVGERALQPLSCFPDAPSHVQDDPFVVLLGDPTSLSLPFRSAHESFLYSLAAYAADPAALAAVLLSALKAAPEYDAVRGAIDEALYRGFERDPDPGPSRGSSEQPPPPPPPPPPPSHGEGAGGSGRASSLRTSAPPAPPATQASEKRSSTRGRSADTERAGALAGEAVWEGEVARRRPRDSGLGWSESNLVLLDRSFLSDLVASSSDSYSTIQIYQPLVQRLTLPPIPSLHLPHLSMQNKSAEMGETAQVHRATLDGHDRLVKMDASARCAPQAIAREALFYLDHAAELERFAPNFFGCYAGELARFYRLSIILEDAGEPLADEWKEVPRELRPDVYRLVANFHEAGMMHNDLTPFNIVRKTGSSSVGEVDCLKLIDFERSCLHACSGPTCEELVKLRENLGMSDERARAVVGKTGTS
ncbi:uncharacterized protein JCM10292_005463 [Rhodotorula paludigena]|uniref:uncharacterized protein n=1 Tax=Rhodotorula paludigena TaxID=86838 RepID=UPI00317903FF